MATTRAIVDANVSMTLATADPDGRPWPTPVSFAPASYRELVRVSAPGARPSQNIAAGDGVVTLTRLRRPGPRVPVPSPAMSRTPLSRLAAGAGLASLLVLGAACGDSDDDTATATATTEAPASTAPPDETTTTEADDATTTTEEGSGAGEPADACSLLTAEDATEALGEEAVPGVTQEAGLCMWRDSADLRTVQLALLDDEPDEWRAARQAGEFEPVEGVGEEAYYGPVFDDLSFLVGDQVYEIDVELRGEGDGLEVTTALAETVISRL